MESEKESNKQTIKEVKRRKKKEPPTDESDCYNDPDLMTPGPSCSYSGFTQVGRKSMSGQTCTLKTLIDDLVLEPGDGILAMEYMGKRFTADLTPNGTIKWPETNQIFSTPSSWVNHCKKIVNPENSGKTGSAWSTIRYKGKRLDSYKLRWYRRQKKIVSNASSILDSAFLYSKTMNDFMSASTSTFFKDSCMAKERSIQLEDPVKMKMRNIVEHSHLGSKLGNQDMDVMVKCTPFSYLDRIQPFTITLSTNAMLLIDFHCHLTKGEVVGYLGGTWDIASHNLAILQAFPCRSRLQDKDRSYVVEEEIRQNLEQRHLCVVGWYHSHPNSAAEPTVKDVESQLEYQITMRGESDSSYIPCVGLICSPFDVWSEELASLYMAYWVMPPPEYKPHEFGRPMQMIYSIARDSFLTQDLLLEMRLLAHFYTDSPDSVDFKENFKSLTTSLWEKLQASLAPNLPRDLQVFDGQSVAQIQVQQQALTHFWAFLKGLIMP